MFTVLMTRMLRLAAMVQAMDWTGDGSGVDDASSRGPRGHHSLPAAGRTRVLDGARPGCRVGQDVPEVVGAASRRSNAVLCLLLLLQVWLLPVQLLPLLLLLLLLLLQLLLLLS